MKILNVISILLSIFLFGCCNSNSIINDDFLQDLAAEDNRVWGELYLDVFDGDLNALTYDYYIAYLDSTRHTAAEEITSKIGAADMKLLQPENKTFWLLLYYKNEDLIIADDASTDIGTVDTVIIYPDKVTQPDLKKYAERIINR